MKASLGTIVGEADFSRAQELRWRGGWRVAWAERVGQTWARRKTCCERGLTERTVQLSREEFWEGTRVSFPGALSRGQRLLVNGLSERAQCLPLLFFIAHVVEGIQAPRNFNRPCVDLFESHRESPASGVD